MVREKDPRRVAINQHLHRHHGGMVVTGDTDARYIAHEVEHARPDEGFQAAGEPLHSHPLDGNGIPTLALLPPTGAE